MTIEEEFTAEYTKGMRLVMNFLSLRMGLPRQEAEEIAQDAWVKAWVHIGTWRRDCSMLTWVNTIAHNAALMAMRKADSRNLEYRGLAYAGAPTSTYPDYDAALDMETCVCKISGARAAVLRLRYIEGLTIDETCKRVGKSIPAVKSLTHWGFVALRREYAKR